MLVNGILEERDKRNQVYDESPLPKKKEYKMKEIKCKRTHLE